MYAVTAAARCGKMINGERFGMDWDGGELSSVVTAIDTMEYWIWGSMLDNKVFSNAGLANSMQV